MGLEPKRIEIIYRDRRVPARKPIMVPRWISFIVLTAVAIWSLLYLIKVL
jgi:fumarate reductase subunit C